MAEWMHFCKTAKVKMYCAYAQGMMMMMMITIIIISCYYYYLLYVIMLHTSYNSIFQFYFNINFNMVFTMKSCHWFWHSLERQSLNANIYSAFLYILILLYKSESWSLFIGTADAIFIFCDCHVKRTSLWDGMTRESQVRAPFWMSWKLWDVKTYYHSAQGIVRTGLVCCHSATYTFLITIATVIFPILISQ